MEIGRASRTASDLRRRLAGAHLAVGGACVGLAVFAALRCRTIGLLSFPIKLADGALKAAGFLLAGGPRSLPHLLLFSYKALLKSYKAARRLNLIKAGEKGPCFGAGRMKAAWGAINLARYAVAASVGGMLGFDLLKAGYKASKSLGKVVEGLAGVRIGSSFRGVIEALGMYVSAVSLYREYAKITALVSKSSTCRFAGKDWPRKQGSIVACLSCFLCLFQFRLIAVIANCKSGTFETIIVKTLSYPPFIICL